MSKQLVTWLAIRLAIVVVLTLLGAVIFAYITGSSATDTISDLRGLIEIVVLVFGAVWILFQLSEYREFKSWIQLEIDQQLYRLGSPVNAGLYSWEKGKRVIKEAQSCTHAIEVRLRFSNKGKTRVRLYNIQISIFTMNQPIGETEFDEESGHFCLNRILTSGNLVPTRSVLRAELERFERVARQAGEELPDEWVGKYEHEESTKVLQELSRIQARHHDNIALQEILASLQKRAKGGKPIDKPVELTSFYYIEPEVQQEFTYLALIPQPRELLQIAARFNLEQRRRYPGKPKLRETHEAIRFKEQRINNKTTPVVETLVGAVTKAIYWFFNLPREESGYLYPHTAVRTFQVDESIPDR